MLDIPIPPKLKLLWDVWDLRCFIILSLLLQTFLIAVAPLRKRTSSYLIMIPLWSAYLLADWVANFSIGLITNRHGDPDCLSSKEADGGNDVKDDLVAFWGPFLLVHLGGPDTITAFALEDNEFWLRHLISLVIQCLATIYVFVQSLPHNQLWIPTMLMFMSGTIKYGERTRAFYLASADRFKWSMNADVNSSLDYMDVVEEYFPVEKENLASTMVSKRGTSANSANEARKRKLTKLEVVQYAYCLFNTFKGLVVDLVFTRRTRNQSRDFFLNRTAEDAFEVVEVELNFIYEVLFTKIPVFHGKVGAISRIFSFVMVCSATVLFVFKSKSKFSTIDVAITYSLLFSALALDIAALLVLMFSKKTILFLLKSRVMRQESPWTQILRRKMEGMFKMRMTEDQAHRWPMGFLKRRWSESIPTCNLIYYCLHSRSKSKQLIYDKLGLSRFADYKKYVKTKRFTVDLKNFIFEELKSKSELADDLEPAMEISSSRGDRVLRVEDGWSRLLPYTLDADYGQRILLWHVATDLCYNKELNDQLNSKKPINSNKDIHRDISKLLSDYMMYLLIMKPSLISGITSMMQTMFSDLCADAMCIFRSGKIHEKNYVKKIKQGVEDIQVDLEQLNACMKIFAIPEEVWQRNAKGDLRKSLLLYSFMLAKEVMTTEEEDKTLNKWVVISKVWVELLCYGAIHSQGKVQAAQVSSGGELITIVWLLMAHFGLGDQFQINQHQEKARLVVD